MMRAIACCLWHKVSYAHRVSRYDTGL